MTYAVSQVPAPSPTLANKVEFLSHSSAYPGYQGEVARRETHMSWVFLTGDRAYKLKKPVRFPYLDFSTLALREAACRAEIRLNRRLASDVYLGVVPLRRSAATLSICGSGEVVDWLVVMRRLDESQMLDRALAEHRVQAWQVDRLVATLVQFYRRATPVFISPERHLAAWHASLLFNRRILLDPRFGLPAGLIGRIDRAQWRFLVIRRSLLADRVRGRHTATHMGTCGRNTSFWAIPCASSTAWNSTPRCARRTRSTKSPFSVSNASAWAIQGLAVVSGAASLWGCKMVRPKNCLRSIAATGPCCGRGWRSPICSNRRRGLRRNGRR